MNEREIFEKAVEILEPAAREQFHLSVCSNNQELLTRMRALLQSHESKTVFLQDSVPEQLSELKKSPDGMKPTLQLPPGSFISQKRLDDEDDEMSPDLSFLCPST